MNVLRELRSVTVNNIGRVPRMNILKSRNALFVDVVSKLSEYPRMPAKRRAQE